MNRQASQMQMLQLRRKVDPAVLSMAHATSQQQYITQLTIVTQVMRTGDKPASTIV